MILGMHSIKVVLGKTDNKCSICGCKDNLVCDDFIPQWTRVVPSVDNVIPICDKCGQERGLNFIEIGKLKYLRPLYLEVLMRYYSSNFKYLKMYVRKFGDYRTRGLIDVSYALTVLSSYDEFVENNRDRLNW